MYLVNVAVQGVIMTALVSSVVVANTNANPDDLTPSNVNLFFKITVVVWCIPIVLACTVSFRSAVRCLLYLPAFLISLSMYVCFIPAAALARMHDLSWGNRNSALDVGGKEREFLAKSIVTNLFAILLNLGILAR